MSNTEQFGKRLNQLRTDRGWTYRDLGSRSGIAISHLSSMEKGRALANYNMLKRLAKAFGVTIGDLLGEEASSFNGDPLLKRLDDLLNRGNLSTEYRKNLHSGVSALVAMAEELEMDVFEGDDHEME